MIPLSLLEHAYSTLLKLPYDSIERTKTQGVLAGLRDAIAEVSGRSSEEVQTDFEEREQNNPDWFTKGSCVTFSPLGWERIGNSYKNKPKYGRIKSKYPLHQMVTVQWNNRKNPDRLHVDFLSSIAKEHAERKLKE